MQKTGDLSYYLIERLKKNKGKKKSTFIIVRFINNSTGERKDVTLTKLRKLIGDKKRFMPSNTLEINRIVDTAIEMGVAPFSDTIKQNDTSLLDSIKGFWNYDKSEYILTKKVSVISPDISVLSVKYGNSCVRKNTCTITIQNKQSIM